MEKKQQTLHRDWTDSALALWQPAGAKNFMIVAMDDSGYIGVHFTKTSWEETKAAIDKFIEQEGIE